MKVLVIGGGGREHALCWKLASSSNVAKLYCAPGNAGIASVAECVSIAAEDVDALLKFSVENKIDLVVIGPEAPLVAGLADKLAAKKIRAFGASARASEIEGSKSFAKKLMIDANIPTAKYGYFDNPDKAVKFASELGAPLVIKADGLAAGKGVVICHSVADAEKTIAEMMKNKVFGIAGEKIIIEEFLVGEEASFIAITDGKTVVPLASSQDHKTVFDGDTGPNTGGMGAYSPAPVVTESVHREIMESVMIPAVQGMAKIGRPYLGALYAGLMIKDGASKTLEFNARFGDPETQPLMARLKSDLAGIMIATIDGKLDNVVLEWDPRPAVCVVMASGGYPGAYQKGKVIEGLEDAAKIKDVIVFHAGTKFDGGKTVTAGGRVLGVTGLGNSIKEAIDNAYKAVAKIHWEGEHHRKDIGFRALKAGSR